MPKPYLLYTAIVVPISVLLPISSGIRNYAYTDRPLRIMLSYLVFAGLLNFTASVLAFGGHNNLWLLHVYSAIEMALISLYFYFLYQEKWMKRVILWIAIVYVIFCIVNALFLQSINYFNTYTRPLQSLLIPLYSMIYLYRGIGSFFSNHKQEAHYWIQIGLIIYFLSSLIQFSLSNIFLVHFDVSIRQAFWIFHATMVLVMYLLFTKAYQTCKK
ncbi:hypothetical protein [Olivibacter ginsenosidimutans]|uniref:hypothetical protein n=1 Tax=Olivibacter ginsenosidimutans TaxID=1176537 RepID=UPI0031EA3DE9